jgi:predicted amino acid-binding ACT domain protein
MQQINRTGRYATKWMALFSMCALTVTLAGQAAHAQAPKPLGAVLSVPLPALGSIFAANAIQNNINVLHVSQAAIGNFNTQIATIGISQKNQAGGGGGGLLRCKLPKAWLPAIKQVNDNTIIVDQVAVGDGNTQVATVDVSQSNQSYIPGKTRFFAVPRPWLGTLGSLNQTNFNEVHVSQLAIGNFNTQIALVSVDQSNSAGLKFEPSMVGTLSQLNKNVAVVGQTAVGDGNTQVAVVNVNQSNG